MNRIRDLRIKRKVSMKQVASELELPYTTYVNYEKGDREPNSETLIKLADYFGVSVDYLIGRSDEMVDDDLLDKVNVIDNDILENCNGNLLYAQKMQAQRDAANSFSLPDNILPLPQTRKIPLLGTIACGEPILATENIECNIDIPDYIHADFALRCKGDSMVNARIMDGDIVYIRQQPDVENGEIAAVLIGDEATLKRVYKAENQVTLMPANDNYPPLVYTGAQLDEVRIIGKAIAFTSAIK